MKQAWIVLSAAAFSLHGCAASANAINTTDGRQPAACDAPVQTSLKAEVTRLADTRNASDAWLVVQTLLCGRGVSARSIVAAHSAPSIRYVMDGPNADPPRALERSAPELQAAYLKGKAWGPTAHEEENALAVVAWTNQIWLS